MKRISYKKLYKLMRSDYMWLVKQIPPSYWFHDDLELKTVKKEVIE